MSEEKIIKKQLVKSMLFNFVAFTIIFTVFGIVIFENLKIEIFKSIDDELLISKQNYSENVQREKRLGLNAPTTDGFIPEKPDENFDKLRIFNPRITDIVRDTNGNILNTESLGRFYEEYGKYLTFNYTNLDKIYEININGYSYRGLNFKTYNKEGEELYVQLLINVDSEQNIMNNYLRVLTLGIVITVLLSLLASYLLSKITLKPIVSSWQKQIEFVQNASHELRTPLTIIQTKQELLLQEPESKIIDKSEDIRLSKKTWQTY